MYKNLVNQNNLILISIILVGSFLRFYGIGYEDFWLDEARTVWFGSKNYDLITAIKRISTDLQGPLYFIFIHFWLYFVDVTEISMRIPSAIFGILSIFFIYKLATYLFNKNIGLYSALILTFSHVHFYHSQEARTYSFSVLLTILSYYYLVRFINNKKVYDALLYIFFTTSLIYSHYYTVFIIFAQNLFFLIIYKQRLKNLSIKYWIKLNSIILLLLIPAAIFFLKYQVHRQRLQRGDEFSSKIILDILTYISGNEILVILLSFLAILTLFGISNYFDSKNLKEIKSNVILLLTWFVIPIVIPVLIALLYKPTFFVKYFLTCSVALYILAAIGIDKFKNKIIKIIILFPIIFYGISLIFNSYEYSEKPRWKDLAAEIDNKYENGDLIIVYPSFSANVLNYYSKSGYLPKKYKYSRKNYVINQMKIDQKGYNFSDYELKKILSKDRIWLVLTKSDKKSEELKNELLKNYNLQSLNKFTDSGYAEAYLYIK